jgi:membrane protease YdiL (CAAX protease family)
MRFLFKLVLLIAGAETLTAFLTYPAWLLVQTVADVPVHRVRDRVAMLLIAAGLAVFLPRWKLATRDVLGYSLPRRVFLRQTTIGFAAGAALVMPLALALLILSIRVPDHGLTPLGLATSLGQGLLTGLAVGFIEETCFRGVIYGGIRRESGIMLATLVSSALYAAGHFLGGHLRVPFAEVTFLSGFRVVGDVFASFEQPLDLIDSFLALSALGILLSLIRTRTGAIAGCVGLHAGAVCAITILRNSSQVNPGSPWAWLAGSYNGVIGWLALPWISVIAIIYWLHPALGRQSKIGHADGV